MGGGICYSHLSKTENMRSLRPYICGFSSMGGHGKVMHPPPGAPPAYRSAEAQQQADEESDAELQRERPRPKRNRYIDDEAKEGSEGDSDG